VLLETAGWEWGRWHGVELAGDWAQPLLGYAKFPFGSNGGLLSYSAAALHLVTM